MPGAEVDWSDRPSISRPVREYLVALDQVEVEKNTPKNISLTDPAAQWSAAGGPAFYAYSANYLTDIAARLVVDVEATPAHKTEEINATRTMIERVEERFDLKPDCLIGGHQLWHAAILVLRNKLVIAGPLAAAIAGAGAGGAAGGLVGALVGRGIPEERVQRYEAGIKKGGILMGARSRSDDDATYFAEDWKKNRAADVYA